MALRFNERLLQGVPGELIPLAKLLLFATHEKISLEGTLHINQGRVVWSEDLKSDLGKVNMYLLKNGAIDVVVDDSADAMLVHPRLRLGSLYVYRDLVSFDISEYRAFFSMNYIGIPNRMGDKGQCEERMEKFLAENPWSYQQLLYATKHFVDWHIARDSEQLIPKADKFLYDNTGVSRLYEHLENINLQPDE